MRFLDLFSGTGSVSRVAESLDYTVTSLDIVPSHSVDICQDIMTWDYTQYEPGHFEIIWASPPCDKFSAACRSNIGRYGVTKESILRDIHLIGLPLLRKTEDIIRYLKPKYFFIENPATGCMKDFVSLHCFIYTVDYCAYSDWGYRKRTNVFTNVKDFEPKMCAGYGVCPNTKDGRHLKSVIGNKKGRQGTGGSGDKSQRHSVPEALIVSLIKKLRTD